jgi:glutamate synthase (NADPH) large chain
MAFVYDADGLFDHHVNGDTVVWQSVETVHWHSVLRNLIEEHQRETSSVFAAELLAHWDVERDNFRQVVPKEMLSRLKYPLSDQKVAAE